MIHFIRVDLLPNVDLSNSEPEPIQLNPEISFFEFIEMHYLGDDGTTADNDIDKKLPCRDISHSSILIVLSPVVGTVVSTDHFFLTIESKDIFRNSHSPTGFTYSIFQPPRHC